MVSSFRVNFIISKGWCKVMKRLFALLSACAVLFFVSAPAFATAVEPGGTGGIGIPIVGNIDVDVVELFEFMSANGEENGRWIVNTVGHLIDEDICPNAPHVGGGHSFVPRRTLKNGQVGRYNVCEYCGKAYGDACQEAYEQYVGTLPGTRYNSNGAFLWVPQVSDFSGSYVNITYSCSQSGNTYTSNHSSCSFSSFGVPTIVTSYNLFFTLYEGDGFVASGRGTSNFCPVSVTFPTLKAPWTAQYIGVSNSVLSSFNRLLSAGSKIPDTVTGSSFVATVGGSSASSVDGCWSGDFDVYWFWPSFWVTPVSGSSNVGSSFTGDTRVSATNNDGTGLYGYMDNGTLVQSAADTIFMESGNVYTNPVTNETKNISSWDYDYTDRSYTLTTNEGDTVTVTYGDTNVTINEGAETYNVYYLVEHDDSVPCDHTYTSQITQSPTCMAGGVKTYTCSICGNTYTEGLPATGHSYSSEVTMAPTCTATGVRTSVCSVCGDTHTETIAATGHSYSSEVTTASTCTATGVRTFTCSVCGDLRTETIPATGHSYSSSVTMEPTCIGTGVRTFVCSVCGDIYTVSIAATGHRWRLVRQEPTVYDEAGQLVTAGYALYQCDTCGEQYRLAAESGGAALPNPAPDSATTSGDTEIDFSVGRGFLATIAHGLTEDLPEVLRSFSTWFVEFPQFYSGFATFLKDGIFVCLPIECQRLIGFGFGMVTAVGIVCKIIGR